MIAFPPPPSAAWAFPAAFKWMQSIGSQDYGRLERRPRSCKLQTAGRCSAASSTFASMCAALSRRRSHEGEIAEPPLDLVFARSRLPGRPLSTISTSSAYVSGRVQADSRFAILAGRNPRLEVRNNLGEMVPGKRSESGAPADRRRSRATTSIRPRRSPVISPGQLGRQPEIMEQMALSVAARYELRLDDDRLSRETGRNQAIYVFASPCCSSI